MKYHLTRKSGNSKTGPIPVSTSPRSTCPITCPFKDNGCYADSGPLRLHWDKVSDGSRGILWHRFLQQIRDLPVGALWRHNQAGDLAGKGEIISITMMDQLVRANDGKKGFTYTQKPVYGRGISPLPSIYSNRCAIKKANELGFTVNLSATNLEDADTLAALKIGPVTVVLPMNGTNTTTPAGRHVVVCPAQKQEKMTCEKCRACANPKRNAIIGFLAHGQKKKIVSDIVGGNRHSE